MHKVMNWSLVAQRTICSATQFAGDICHLPAICVGCVYSPLAEGPPTGPPSNGVPASSSCCCRWWSNDGQNVVSANVQFDSSTLHRTDSHDVVGDVAPLSISAVDQGSSPPLVLEVGPFLPDPAMASHFEGLSTTPIARLLALSVALGLLGLGSK